MHFITGGFFNGKGAWVKSFYRLDERKDFGWFSAYRGERFRVPVEELDKDLVVLEGMEQWVKNFAEAGEMEMFLKNWLKWERASHGRTVVMIGADLTKGVVPVDAQDRKWRDKAGRLFQFLSRHAERVDLVWYGIGQKLK